MSDTREFTTEDGERWEAREPSLGIGLGPLDDGGALPATPKGRFVQIRSRDRDGIVLEPFPISKPLADLSLEDLRMIVAKRRMRL